MEMVVQSVLCYLHVLLHFKFIYFFAAVSWIYTLMSIPDLLLTIDFINDWISTIINRIPWSITLPMKVSRYDIDRSAECCLMLSFPLLFIHYLILLDTAELHRQPREPGKVWTGLVKTHVPLFMNSVFSYIFLFHLTSKACS